MNYLQKIKRYFWISQIGFYLPLIVCVLIRPGVVIHNGGVSNFGNYANTFVLYILAFVFNVGFILAAARSFPNKPKSLRNLSRAFVLLCLIEGLVLVSTFPRHFSFTFSYIHDYLGIAQFIVELFVSLWILIKLKNKFGVWAFFIVQTTGFVIGLLSILKVVDLLFDGQFVGSVGFGCLLIFVLPSLIGQLTTANLKN